MLKGVSPILSPELLYVMAQMGHGDEIVLADANFPAVSMAKRMVRADGHSVAAILEPMLKLFPLDDFSNPAMVMAIVGKPEDNAPIWGEYQRILDSAEARHIELQKVERFEFYERAKAAFAVVATGESALYGNLMLRKGVIRPA